MKIIDQGKLTGLFFFFFFGHIGIYIRVKFQSTCVAREVFVAESASSIFQVNIGRWSFLSCFGVEFMLTKRKGFQQLQ